MTRIARFTALLCLLALFAVPVFAQDAMPVPAAPDGFRAANVTDGDDGGREIIIIIPLAAQPVFPINDAQLTVSASFGWTNANADSYQLKVKNTTTGEKLAYSPTVTCNPTQCWASTYNMDIFDHTSDGDRITWQVISILGGTKFKSIKATATIEEIAPVAVISPADKSTVSAASFEELTWVKSIATVSAYKVTVKDLATKETVLVRFFVGGDSNCMYSECSLPISYGERNVIFKVGKSFQWTVTTIGLTGERATTKAKFTLQ
jgi:hypothetical protein